MAAKLDKPPPRTAPAAPRPAPEGARRRGRRALDELSDQLALAFDTASPEEHVRAALRRLGQARSNVVADEAGLPVDVAREAIQALRARGEVVHVGRGRGTEYRLA